jgi:SAM-dependent methyltransferase
MRSICIARTKKGTRMQFHLDQITSGFIAGWCVNGDQPVHLALLVNGRQIAATTANRYRKDLEDAGIGSGKHAYVFHLRRPGLLDGDEIEIRDAHSEASLHQLQLSSTDRRGLEAAYDFIDSTERFAGPYWRPVLIDIPGGKVSLQGELFVPPGAGSQPDLYCDGEVVSAEIEAAIAEKRDRYWFLDGSVLHAKFVTTIGPKRRLVYASNQDSPAQGNDLAFGVIPSKSDMDMFKFAGSDRARRVAGGDDTLVRFASGGLTAATQLLHLIDLIPKFPQSAKVLDWGCGAARVLQFLRADRPYWTFSGVDIDEVNISWCLENIPDAAAFQQIPLMPPMPYDDSLFDLVYGLSVITHLEEPTRNAWLSELARVTKAGGVCVLSFMSPFHVLQTGINEWSLPLIDELAVRGIADHLTDSALGSDLSSYYKATYNTLDNLKSAVKQWFDVVSFHPRSLLFQDTVVLRRR